MWYSGKIILDPFIRYLEEHLLNSPPYLPPRYLYHFFIAVVYSKIDLVKVLAVATNGPLHENNDGGGLVTTDSSNLKFTCRRF